MMKIRYALLLSVSCLGFGTIANAGLIPDITPVGKNTSIFTQRGAPAGESLLRVSRSSYTHLASQSKLLSASVFARRTLFDAAIHNNINGSPRGLSSARDDNSGTAYGREDYFFDLDVRVKPEHDIANFLSTHPVFPYQGKGHYGLSPVFPLLIERVRVSRSFPIPAQGARSAFHAPISQPLTDRVKLRQLASVCFITDAGNCRGDEYDYGGANTPDNSSGGTPGGGGSSGGDNGNTDEPEWELDNKERCNKEGYMTTSCSSVQDPVNHCPYDNSYFEKCVCKPGLVTCTKPYYGVGESCGGKYASCQLDNPRACKEDGYTQTGSCNSVQNINRRCPYDANYFDKCVCRSGLYTCSSPLQGVGTACGGKYTSCRCPSSYKSCSCGASAGASSCTWGGTTKYSSCKSCCSCSSGSTRPYCSSSQRQVSSGTDGCGNTCYKCEEIVCEDQKVYNQVVGGHCEGTTYVYNTCTKIQDYYISNGSCVRGTIPSGILGCIDSTVEHSTPNSVQCK